MCLLLEALQLCYFREDITHKICIGCRVISKVILQSEAAGLYKMEGKYLLWVEMKHHICAVKSLMFCILLIINRIGNHYNRQRNRNPF